MKTDWGKKLESAQALWRMNPNASGAHALLTSGKHSDGYCNGAKIVQDPQLVSEVAVGIINNVKAELGEDKPDWVVGPAYGAITFAQEVARQWGTKYGFTEVDYTDEGKMQVLKRFDIPAEDTVLVIEDMVTTGGSALKTVEVLKATGVNVLPYLPIILNWSGKTEIDGYKIVPLIEARMNVYDPETCPLCQNGSQAVRPKSHWSELAR